MLLETISHLGRWEYSAGKVGGGLFSLRLRQDVMTLLTLLTWRKISSR